MSGRGGRRGLALASAAWVLAAAAACRGDDAPASAGTEGGSSSSGAWLDAADTTDDGLPYACTPGEARACYDGPPGTEGQGPCAAGQQVCEADGRAWSECAGQVRPEPAERCDTPEDDDCDGLGVCEPTLEWSQTIPGQVSFVAGTAGGGVVVVGTQGFDEFQGEDLEGMFVVELDAAGALVWARSMGERQYGWPGALAVDDTGAVVVAGWYAGELDLGGGPLPAVFTNSAYAVRYEPGGAHVWSHAYESSGYHAAALGRDGTTYLAGGYVYDDADAELESAPLHVTAIAPDGSVAWVLPGRGDWNEAPVSLVLGEADEPVLVATVGGFDLQLGDRALAGSVERQPILVRIGRDGTPLAERWLLEPTPPHTYEVRMVGRPGGAVAVATVVQAEDEGSAIGSVVVALDETLAPGPQRFLGPGTWARALAPYPGDLTLLIADFSGLLELGPIGVGGNGPALAAVDDEGNGRWAELVHGASYDLLSVSAASDGAVLVSGYVDGEGGTLAGGPVGFTFVAKLRP